MRPIYQHKNELGAILLMAFFVLFSPAIWAENENAKSESLSDLSLDVFKNLGEKDEKRNPFLPVATDGGADPSTLNLEGLIVNRDTKYCLISGKILKEGQAIGTFTIKEIKPDGITVSWPKGLTKIPMESYVGNGEVSTPPNYDIIFEKASLINSLKLIATVGDFNIIMPEDLSGQVSVAFQNTLLKNALGAILRVNKLEFAEENKIVRVGKIDDFVAGAYYESRYITLKYAKAADLLATVKSQISDKGSVTSDERTNTLIIKDSQAVLDNVYALIESLDRADTQVRIEAKIVGVTRNFSRALGIQWGFTKDSGNVQGFGAPTVGTSPISADPLNFNFPAVAPTSGVGILLGNVTNNMNIDAQITAAETNGEAKVISQPSVTTINNAPAKIRSGVKLFVKTTSSISVGGSGGSATSNDSGLDEIDTGIELTVTPQISVGDMVKMTIEAEESEADFGNTVDGIPSVRDNHASTTVLVKNGHTTVIGGLMKVSKSTTSNGVPVISSVPLLGWLFKNKSKKRDDTELLIFITPYIVNASSPPVPHVGSNTASVSTEVILDEKKKKVKKARKNKYSR
ncbi:MAG TPA: hypothetical protein DDW49_11250 [Deltaproteobacteria bacterium]|nr:hypothetical protein [Deltaproteobacteria bacterium]